MHDLRQPDRTVTSNPVEIRNLAGGFYKDLYGTESCDSGSAPELLQELSDDQWTTQSHFKAGILSLEQEKAFDHVDHVDLLYMF